MCKNTSIKNSNWCICSFDLTFLQTKPVYKHQQKTKHFIFRTGHNTLFESHRICTSTFYRALEGQKKFCSFSCKRCFSNFILGCTYLRNTGNWIDAVSWWSYIIVLPKKGFLLLLILAYLLLLLSLFFRIQKIQQTAQKNFAFLFFALLAWHFCVACLSVHGVRVSKRNILPKLDYCLFQDVGITWR